MRIFLISFALQAVVYSPAHAADAPLFGPPPPWIRSVAPAPSPSQSDGTAVRILLSDQQVFLDRDKQTSYTNVAFKIESAQGLAAGNISIPWRPDTSALTVHKLVIRRGDRTIDVLASGEKFSVIRRETNLESATLDGVLTATLQPQGLQVGDVLELSASIVSSDPTLKGHAEMIGGSWGALPVGRAHLLVQWPSSLPFKLRKTDAMPAFKTVTSGGITSIEMSADNLDTLVPPKLAPERFGLGRLVEVSDFASWGDVAALFAPLYRAAAVIAPHSPLAAEVARIRALSPDPKRRAEAALERVQEDVRYVALLMGTGNLVPTDASTTWARRFGDCKAKTALLLALLHDLDIPAEPVAVNALSGDGLDERLPMTGLFNHVLVRATIAGHTYWLDGTRTGDKQIDSIAIPNFGWGLPLVARGGALVRMMPPPLQAPSNDVKIRIDATAGIDVSAPTHVETVFRGDAATVVNAGLANLSATARERALKEYWKNEYDFIEAKTVSATFDPLTGEQRLTLDGDAKMDWSSGYYETDGSGLGYKADFSREPGAAHDAPFAVSYPYYTRTSEAILLPPGFKNSKPTTKSDINETVAGIEYRRMIRFVGNTVTIETSQRSLVPEISAREAVGAQSRLRELANDAVYLRKPSSYSPTDKDLAAAVAITPKTYDGYFNRGLMMFTRQRFDEAIADFDQAARLDPKSAWPLANRGIARVWKNDLAGAAKDIDAALSLDPENAVAFRARGLMAERKEAVPEAIAAYTHALQSEPKNAFSLGRRAQLFGASHDYDRALSDSADAIKLNPQWSDLYLLRANIFRSQGKKDQAIAEAAALVAANPDQDYAHVAAANIFSSYRMVGDAMREYDRAIAIKPDTYIYINRSLARPKSDIAGRKADLDQALKLDPKSTVAISLKAALLADAGNGREAIATYTTALALEPDNAELIAGRGLAYAKANDVANAEKDFAAARSHAKEAGDFNSLCWAKATAGVALESALIDCNAALAKSPNTAAYFDSRALVYLRLGRLDDAIADYDRALAKVPNQTASLFGRAVAWSRKGNKQKADSDTKAALKYDPNVKDRFADYGIAP